MKILEHAFESLPMVHSGSLIKLAKLVDGKSNIRASVKQIFKRTKSTAIELKIREQRVVIEIQLFTRNHGR